MLKIIHVRLKQFMQLCMYVGDGEGGLSKVQLGKIANGDLAYDDGLDDHYVFQGKTKVLEYNVIYSYL